MSAFVQNEVRKGTYLDSVALMRMSRSIAALDGVEEAALMMGTPANHEILANAGLLDAPGQNASGGDLILAVRATTEEAAEAALQTAREELEAPTGSAGSTESAVARPKSIQAATTMLPDANIALISAPGAFAISEARKAIHAGLHAMIFSDNVPIEDEASLKSEAQMLGKMVMGPDCGTSIIAGTPLAFANVVPRGDIGIVGASGTGIQEVSCLIAHLGGGISHAIGTGGRDLKSEVGGITSLMAIDALAADAGTKTIVVLGKPPGAEIAAKVLDKLASCGKPAVFCFMGSPELEVPEGIEQSFSLQEAAHAAMQRPIETAPVPAFGVNGTGIIGLYSGGTLCAEAQVVLRSAGLSVSSNASITGVENSRTGDFLILDLGDDEFTQGRPHPMIDPAVREAPLVDALASDDIGVVLVDVVIGYGAHEDPARELADVVKSSARNGGPAVICSVTGTDGDPQGLQSQIETLRDAGVHVAPCAADAARWALAATGRG